jgi:hypothetical protein
MADLSVYSGVHSAAEDLLQKFEHARACRLAVSWSTAPILVAGIEARRIDPQPCRHRHAAQSGKVAPGSDVTLEGSGVAIAVAGGASDVYFAARNSA